MTTWTVLDSLTELKQELARAGRAREVDALSEALNSLAKSADDLIPIDDAADRFGLSAAQMRDWIARGGLVGREIESQWFVSAEDLDRHARVREAIQAIGEDGCPTDEEVQALYEPSRRRTSPGRRVAAGRS